jgi:16S rRNA (cytosine1402-N4)-methyltransferase
MNKDSSLSAYDLLNNYQEKELENLFTTFGDFKTVESKRLAKSIVAARSNGLLKTTFQLVSSIESLVPQKIRNQFLARVFQAIRIEVNQELTALVDFLNQLPRILKKEGVVSIITYHSLEDRLVKNFFRTGNCNGVLEKDFYGNTSTPFLAINKKPIIPESEEIKMNPRSRSAKLRIAKRI